MKVIFSIVFLQIILWQTTFCQRETTYNTEISTVLGTEQTPFWMRANKYGMVPTKGNSLIMQIGAKSDYEQTNKNIQWGYGLNLGGFVGMQNKFIVQEAYTKAKWKAFEIYVGRRKEIQGLVDTALTSGSYIWSGNALPMPKIDLSIQNYTSLGGEGLISIKGNYAHGWFDRKRDDVVGVLLHQKSGYFRIGKPNYKVKVYAGFNHQAQWGGQQLNINGRKLESSFKDYLNIIIGKSNVGEDSTGLDPNSAGNRTGNHLGSLDLGFEFNFVNTKIFIYRQSIFEDGSLFYLNNITDGLHGIGLTLNKYTKSNFKLKRINFEFLSTLSQGGILGSEGGIPASRRGRDNYFNNSDFSKGWSYQNTVIGTPFMLSQSQYSKNHNLTLNNLFFTNNRVEAYSISLQGNASNQINFIGKYSFSKNWGSYEYEFLKFINQSSLFVQINKDFLKILGGVNIYGNIVTDFGNLLDSNFGIQFGVKKSWDSFPFNQHPTHRHIKH